MSNARVWQGLVLCIVAVTFAPPLASVSEAAIAGTPLTAWAAPAAPDQAAAVTGRVFADSNRSGLAEPGEAGLAGATLFVDVDGDGLAGSIEPRASSEADGAYVLGPLPAGSQRLCLVIPTGQRPTTARCATASLAAGSALTHIDFGLTPAAGCTGGAALAALAGIAQPAAPETVVPPQLLAGPATGAWAGTRVRTGSATAAPLTYLQYGERTQITLTTGGIAPVRHAGLVLRVKVSTSQQQVLAVTTTDGLAAVALGKGSTLPSPLPTTFSFFDKSGEVYVFGLPVDAAAPADLKVTTRVLVKSGTLTTTVAIAGVVTGGKLASVGGTCGTTVAAAAFTGAGGPIEGALPAVVVEGRPALSGRLVVGFHGGADAVAQARLHADVRRAGPRAWRLTTVGQSAHLIDAGTATLAALALQRYRADSRVAFAEPDFIAETAAVPNDPLLAQQWALSHIGAPVAWAQARGAAPVTVAILDSGMNEGHPDLAGRVIARRDFTSVPYRATASDVLDHGTRVAGVVAALPDNGSGIAGVAHDVRLLNGKIVLDTNVAVTSAVAPAIAWAVDQGASIINLSVAKVGACPRAVQDAIDAAGARGVLVVAAAGNHGRDEATWPAGCRDVVAVAATTAADQRRVDSNFGAWVALAAPGQDILSTNAAGGYGTDHGTSYAAPHVAGAAALVLATCGPQSPQALTDRLVAAAVPITPESGWAFRRLDAGRAVCERTTPPPGGITPAVADSNTLVLDRFDGATAGEAFGTLSYGASQPGLGQAVSLSPGRFIRYGLPGWYGSSALGGDAATQGTIEFWVRYQVVGDLLNLNWNSTTTQPPAGHVLYGVVDPDGHPTYTTWNSERCCRPADLSSPMVLPTGEWLHLALSWGPTGSRIYVNGAVVAASADNVYPAGPLYAYLNIWGANPTVALVDEFHLSKVQRSEAEIRRHAGLAIP
ncbi:MAG: S8 family serine peptidase [Chloroflexi bacterium]|nr:S8 family serine peptidase [Chloroflexota bacterium]